MDSEIDRDVYRWVNRLADRTSWAHGAFKFNAEFGIVVFAVLLLAAFLDARAHDRAVDVAGSVWAGAAALVALGIGQLIGGAVDRLRPYEAMSDVHVLVHRTTDFSIPSDHATAAGAVAVGLWLSNRRWGLPAVVAAIVMAFTRVYVGAHYPSDVIAGLLLGGVVAAIGHLLVVPTAGRLVSRLAPTPLRPLITAARR